MFVCLEFDTWPPALIIALVILGSPAEDTRYVDYAKPPLPPRSHAKASKAKVKWNQIE